MSPRRLLVLSSNPEGPGVRHRWLAYAEALAGAGVALEVADWGKSRALRREALARARAADGVVVASRLLQLLDVRRLRAATRRLAFDFDDALPFRDTAHGATPSRTRGARFRAIVARADRVFAGNAYLADLVRAHARTVTPPPATTVLPTTVHVPPAPPAAPPDPAPGEAWVIGWIGSRATLPYLEGLGDALARFVAGGGRLRVRAIADAAPRMPAAVPVEAVPWTLEGWEAALAGSHVGVAPLPDDAWTRGKCGLKILQMMALGRPVVASPVGVQAEQVRDGVTGCLAATPADMVAALARLLEDGNLRRRMGAAAHAEANRAWSVASWAPRVVAAVEDLLA